MPRAADPAASARRRVLVPVIIAALAVASGCGGGAEEVPREFFGVNAQLLEPLPAQGYGALANQHLAQIESLGVDFVRANLDWSLLEPAAPGPGRPSFNYTPTDDWVAALAIHHLRWQVTGIGMPTPSWAAAPGGATCGSRSPAEPRAFATMMGALAARYGSGGDFWAQNPGLPYEPITQFEVWNEPNYGYSWCPRPDPAAYAALYADARQAIHEADPTATVLFAGLASFRTSDSTSAPFQVGVPEFLDAALQARPDLRASIDAVAVHPYAATPADVLDTLGWLRSTLDSHGLEGVPMSINEVGWVTSGYGGPPPVSEATRAAYMRELTEQAPFPGCDVIAFAPHSWISRQRNPVDAEDWWGLANPATGAPYSTAIAYRGTLRALESGGSDAARSCGS